MPIKSKKTKFVGFSITEKDTEMLDYYVENTNVTSRSEALRHCIQLSFNKEFPDYVHKLTPAAVLKKRKLEEIQTFEQMTGEDYARSINALILESQDGIKWAFFHQIGNSVKGYLVDDLKTLDSDPNFKSFIRYHNEVLQEKTIESVLNFGSFWTNHLLKEYDIIWVNDSDERDDNQDSGLSATPKDSSLAAERPSDSDNPSGSVSGIPAGEQSGTAGHTSDNAAERTDTDGGSEDGEGQTAPGSDSLSGAIEKLRSHSPRS